MTHHSSVEDVEDTEEHDEGSLHRLLTREEVAQHNTRDSCYTVIHGKVYDITHYMAEHPGGVDLMFRNAGKDSTSDFEAMFHGKRARDILPGLYVGDLKSLGVTASSSNHLNRFTQHNRLTPSYLNPAISIEQNGNGMRGGYGPYGLFNKPQQQQSRQSPFGRPFARPTRPVVASTGNGMAKTNRNFPFSEEMATPPPPPITVDISESSQSQLPAGRVVTKQVMTKKLWQKFKLHSVITENHNTKIFKFKLPSKKMRLTIQPGKHIHIRVPAQQSDPNTGDDANFVVRKYTPIRTDEPGSFDLLVKRYEGGPVSTFFHNMVPGDELAMRGFFGLFAYDDTFRQRYRRVGLVCCGTGIAPMYQILRSALVENATQDNTQFHMLYSSRTEKDILLKDELDALYQMHSDRFQVHYLLSRPKEPEYPLRGHLNLDLYSSYISRSYDENTFILVCGTTGFANLAVDISKQIGYSSDQIHTF